MRVRAILCGFLMLAAAILPLRASAPITMRVTPTMCFAPADVRINAMIESDPANRAVQVAAESRDFYRSSEIQLDGDAAPRTTEFSFRALPTGEYTVTATLFGANGKFRASTRRLVRVMSNG
jgi:hypothetical protein